MSSAAARIEISPYCSLSPRGARLFFGGICGVSFGIAGFVALQGFWPVLPFAGLEMLLLGWALQTSMRRRFHSQIVTVSDADVRIEERNQKTQSSVVFPRHWARVRIHAGYSPLHPSRLCVESHGRSCEVGSFLNEMERRGLAERLKRLIGRLDESPTLPTNGLNLEG